MHIRSTVYVCQIQTLQPKPIKVIGGVLLVCSNQSYPQLLFLTFEPIRIYSVRNRESTIGYRTHYN